MSFCTYVGNPSQITKYRQAITSTPSYYANIFIGQVGTYDMNHVSYYIV